MVAKDLKGPEGIALAPDGKLIVAEVGAKRIIQIDPARRHRHRDRRQPADRIAGRPRRTAEQHPDRRRCWGDGGDLLLVGYGERDLQGYEKVGVANFASSPLSLCFSRRGNYLCLSDAIGQAIWRGQQSAISDAIACRSESRPCFSSRKRTASSRWDIRQCPTYLPYLSSGDLIPRRVCAELCLNCLACAGANTAAAGITTSTVGFLGGITGPASAIFCSKTPSIAWGRQM